MPPKKTSKSSKKDKVKVNVQVTNAIGKNKNKSKKTSGRNSVPSRAQMNMNYSNAHPLQGARGMTFAGGPNGSLVVSGSEVFAPVVTSQTYRSYNFVINPSNILLFPKLQGLALQFEEFNVRSLQVQFLTAGPTTRSGSVSMMVDYDPQDPLPKSVLEVMGNSTSVTGSSGENLRINFDPKAQRLKYYYMRSPSAQYSPQTDLRQIAPGQVIISTDNATSADNGLISGYLKVVYDIEFKTMRPAPESFGAFSELSTALIASSPADSYQFLDVVLDNGLGYLGWDKNKYIAPIPGSLAKQNNIIALSAGKYLISCLWDWLGIGTESDDEKDLFQESPRQYVSSQNNNNFKLVHNYRPSEEKKVERKVPENIEFRSVKQLEDGTFVGRTFGSDDWVHIPPGLPSPSKALVSGDINLAVATIDAESGEMTPLMFNFVNSASAVHLERVMDLTLLKTAWLVPNYNMANDRTLEEFRLDFTGLDNE